MKQLTLLRITGIISFLFTLFHLAFPLMPYWESSLNAMVNDMKYIFITYHYALTTFLFGMGYILTFQLKKLIDSPVKNSILFLFSSLFIIRIITEFALWKVPMPQAIFVLPFCVFPVLTFGITIFSKTSVQTKLSTI